MSCLTVLLLVCQALTAAPDRGSRPSPVAPTVATVDDAMHVRRAAPMRADAGLARWLDVSSAMLAIRYRLLEADGAPATSQVQMAAAFRGRFRLDADGRVSVHAGVQTGRGFSGGWNTTGIGTGAFAHDLAAKDFYLGVTNRGRRFELQAGGFPILRGESTEATTYDNDGALVGERVIARPGRGVEVAVTRAFLGDFQASNVVGRLGRLGRANYYQALLSRRTARAGMSMDYTVTDRSHVIRAGVSLAFDQRSPIHRLRVEPYVRVSPAPAFGFAASVQRVFSTSAMVTVGLSRVDEVTGRLNGDLYGRGTRMFGSVGRRIRGAWMAIGQTAVAVSPLQAPGSRLRVDLAVAYDLARAWARQP